MKNTSVAGKVNDCIKSAQPYVQNLPKGSTSKNFRIGVTNLCLSNPG